MLKRLFWLTVGIGFGFGMSFWVSRFVRDKVTRWSPENVSAELARAMRDLGDALKVAVSEGREAMREREAELREAMETTPAR